MKGTVQVSQSSVINKQVAICKDYALLLFWIFFWQFLGTPKIIVVGLHAAHCPSSVKCLFSSLSVLAEKWKNNKNFFMPVHCPKNIF